MKKRTTTLLLIAWCTCHAWCQQLTQTVRGTVLDTDSKQPLVGVGIVVLGTDPRIGTTTDAEGNFKLSNIPIGKITLQLFYVGYENMSIPNIEVNSGKEVVLNLNMQESVLQTEEVVVEANKDKGEAMNDMAMVSARSISADDSKRYAGSFNDPARVLANYAGVASSQDGSNDIIVRGNSPKYVQWRLEGVEITTPNHFADQSAVGGALSAINNNFLAASDFYTGAFSPEFGDVLAGVYDLRLRNGNNQKFEAGLGVGILGTDVMLEGPFKKGYGGSFLVNYRYSTVTLIDKMGLIGNIGGVPKFQDGAFKLVLPTKKIGEFSLFALTGSSSFLLKDVKPGIWELPGDRSALADISEDYEKKSYLVNTGLNHTLPLNEKGFLRTSLSYSVNAIQDEIVEFRKYKIYGTSGEFLRDSLVNSMVSFDDKLNKSTTRFATTYNHKFDARNKIQIGTKYALFGYDYRQNQFLPTTGTKEAIIDFHENIGTLRNFVSWKHRFNSQLAFVAGVHNMNVLYNQKSTMEPRLAFHWRLNHTNSLSLGYGLHSTMESINNYFAKIRQKDGSVVEPNKQLDLLKAHHYVLGYEKRFSANLMAKAEVYYQDLYNVPVENSDTSSYTTLNEGLDFKYVALVNKGTGKNYGVEVTLERFFARKYYYLLNGSLYNATYRAMDGVERNTQFNGNYMVNFLCGKEFDQLGKKKNQTLVLNLKVFFGGGKKIIPLLRDDQGNLAINPAQGKVWDYGKAYQNKLEDIYSITLSASYKFNRPKTTHEIFVNLDNITDNKGKLAEFYDATQPNSIGYRTQFGLFPNLMYRLYL